MNAAFECPAAAGQDDALPFRTDEDLLLAYRRHDDREAFEQLVRRYEKELFGYLRNRLGSREAAEDVFQQTFLLVHLKCGQFQPGRKFRPWLYAVAIHQAIDYQRQHARHRLASLDAPAGLDPEGGRGTFAELLLSGDRGPAERAELTEQCRWLSRALRRLPEPTLRTLMLVYFESLSYREVAAALPIPLGTVKSRIHAAIERLRQAIAPLEMAES